MLKERVAELEGLLDELKALDHLLFTDDSFTIEITAGHDPPPVDAPSGLIDVNVVLDPGKTGQFRQFVVRVEGANTFLALVTASDKVRDLLHALHVPAARQEAGQ